MDDLLRANVTGGAFRGVGGGYFAIGGPDALEKEDERKRTLDEEADLLNFGHKRARADEEFKSARVQDDLLVRRQQLNTKWKDFEKHLGALHKRFATNVKAKMYQEARNKVELKWNYEDGVQAVKEASTKAKEQQALTFETLEDLEAQLPGMLTVFQQEKDKMAIVEESHEPGPMAA